VRAVVLGAGRIGFGVAKELSLNANDVSVVDFSAEVLKVVSERLDVKPICGHAADIEILKEAGIEEADAVIAVTPSDEVNITACQIADFMFAVETRIARVSKRSYFMNGEIFVRGRLPIDVVVSPEVEVSELVRRSISIPGATDVINCMGDLIKVIGVVCQKVAPIVDMTLKYLSTMAKDLEIAVICIRRGQDKLILPTEDDIIIAGDEVYIACRSSESVGAMKLFGYDGEWTSRIVMIGGGDMCSGIIDTISRQTELDLIIKIIEQDIRQAEFLSEKLNDVEIIHGDPLKAEVLEAAKVGEAELVISMTDDDKTNVLSCLLSKKMGTTRVSAVLNESSYADLPHALGINTILDSRLATISKILQYLRKGGIENVIEFVDGEVEVFVIEVPPNSYTIGSLTRDIVVKNEAHIAALARSGDVTLLPKNLLIEPGDKILVVAKSHCIDKLLKMFQAKPTYLS
jgi:trk system potassium uptake protein TrkA